MRLRVLLGFVALLLLTLSPIAAGAAPRTPRIPVPSGLYTGTYQSDHGDTGTLEIRIDDRGNLTGSGETEDGGTFTLRGRVTVNQRTGVASGKLTYQGSDYKGSATLQVGDGTLTGTYRGKSGRDPARGSFALTKS